MSRRTVCFHVQRIERDSYSMVLRSLCRDCQEFYLTSMHHTYSKTLNHILTYRNFIFTPTTLIIRNNSLSFLVSCVRFEPRERNTAASQPASQNHIHKRRLQGLTPRPPPRTQLRNTSTSFIYTHAKGRHGRATTEDRHHFRCIKFS